VLPNSMHSTFSKRSGLKTSVQPDSDRSAGQDKPTSRFLMFAQKLISNNRRTRNRSYTSPEVTTGYSTASDPNASSGSLSIHNGLMERLRLQTNGKDRKAASTSQLDIDPIEKETKPRFDSPQRDFCVQHLTKQIVTLQSALQTSVDSNTIYSDDTLAMAIAELKKIRDVIDGSLLLDEVRELPSNTFCQATSTHSETSRTKSTNSQDELQSSFSNISSNPATENDL
jgi:hypothetical protein